jgi:hypothetical protein
MVDLNLVAAELYSGSLSSFTNDRKRAGDEAAAEGDPSVAAAIRKLAKPSVAAWLVNAFVRNRPEQMADMVDLGESLEAAQSALDRDLLVELTRRRRELLAAIDREAPRLAESLGERASAAVVGDVHEAMQAAIIDQAARRAVLSGLLIRTSGAGGWENATGLPVDEAEAPQFGRAARRPKAAGSTSNVKAAKSTVEAQRIVRLREEAANIQRAVTAMQSRVGDLELEVDETQRDQKQLEALRDDLRKQLADAERQLAHSDKRLTSSADRLAQATRELDSLEAQARTVQADLDETDR